MPTRKDDGEGREAHGREARLQQREDAGLRLSEQLGVGKARNHKGIFKGGATEDHKSPTSTFTSGPPRRRSRSSFICRPANVLLHVQHHSQSTVSLVIRQMVDRIRQESPKYFLGIPFTELWRQRHEFIAHPHRSEIRPWQTAIYVVGDGCEFDIKLRQRSRHDSRTGRIGRMHHFNHIGGNLTGVDLGRTRIVSLFASPASYEKGNLSKSKQQYKKTGQYQDRHLDKSLQLYSF